MKKINVIALAILLLASCKKESNELNSTVSAQDELSSNTNARKIAVPRPFEITFYTTKDTNSTIPPTSCSGDLPGFANAGVFLHGTATHLGLIDSLHSRLQDVNCNLSFATALLTTNFAGQMAAQNGDLIFYTGDDEINVYNLLTGAGTTGTITGVWTITGGTGRFEGASGSFTINGPVDFTTATFSGTGIGTITY